MGSDCDRALLGAGAKQRMAGLTVLATVRLQPMKSYHPTLTGDAHAALGRA